jgi:hypothetical protein|tara:strand:- start:208 stop:1389 length:1182 start_codon:yes stop_codon:yes gene_type:complete
MAQTPIWPGSSSFSSGSGQTPFGWYDADAIFAGSGNDSVDRFADWAARRLGYPVMDVELQSGSFYACYEESITEYSSQVNQFNILDNLLQLRGQSTGSDLTHKNVTPTLGRSVQLSKQYGTEATLPVGGNVDLKKGSITVTSGSQEYDLNALYAAVSESGKAIEIRRVYHGATPAIQRYFDPYATTGYGTQNLIEGFGFGSYSPAVSFTMMPIFEDLLRVQAIELNDEIRKSAYSFHLVNNKLRIFPDPSDSFKVWFDYYITEDKNSGVIEGVGTSATGSISDFSNVPYNNMVYSQINDTGKQWIRKYGLALSKEILGAIRSKYGTIPIPNSEVTMDGDALRTEAAAEKEQLITQLRETLEQTSRRSLTEKDQEESEFLQQKLNKVPIPIFIG